MLEQLMRDTSATALVAGFLALNTANSIVRALVEKGVLSHEDAADIYGKISADTLIDTKGMDAERVAPVFTVWLDEVAESFQSHALNAEDPAKPQIRIVVDNETDGNG